MEAYREDDFVLLKSKRKLTVNRADKGKFPIFQIDMIDHDGYILKDVSEKVYAYEIKPILIDCEEAHWIYYEPFFAAGFIAPGECPPEHHSDYSYFMDYFNTFERDDKGKNMYDIVIEAKFQYVHEVQHWLKEQHPGPSELRINDMVIINRMIEGKRDGGKIED